MTSNQKFALGLIAVLGVLYIANERSKTRSISLTAPFLRLDI